MKVTIFVESDEARVLALGFQGSQEFNYGYEIELPIPELVAYQKAKDAWLKSQERLEMIYRARLKRHNKIMRRIDRRLRMRKKL